jgi:hypothetical protein
MMPAKLTIPETCDRPAKDASHGREKEKKVLSRTSKIHGGQLSESVVSD